MSDIFFLFALLQLQIWFYLSLQPSLSARFVLFITNHLIELNYHDILWAIFFFYFHCVTSGRIEKPSVNHSIQCHNLACNVLDWPVE